MTKCNRTTLLMVKLFAILVISITLIEQINHVNCQQQQQGEDPANGGLNGGLLSSILYPLRATLQHARRFLGHRMDNVADGVDLLRMESFKIFMRLYNKTYSPEEIPRRMALFFDRRKEIENSIKAFSEGRLPFMMRENPFIDMEEAELKTLTGVSPPRSPNELSSEELEAIERDNEIQVHENDNDGDKATIKVTAVMRNRDGDDDGLNMTVRAERIPAQKDWRTSGCISTPINQLKCGACYAIATMSVVESMRCIRQVSSPILAPQQIVDCATPRAGYQNFGCDGGWPTRVLKYLQDVRVAARETCYPFVRRQTMCRLRQVQSSQGCTVPANPGNSGPLSYRVLNNERDILYHVAKTGPVVTVMRATDKFLYYGSGIFDDPSCSRRRDDVDHAIVIVGYGQENGQDYWLIKNSWGTTSWGMNGYGKYRRGKNACSIGHWGWVLTS